MSFKETWAVGSPSGGGTSAAEDVSFTPAGGIAATDVQAAIEELDTEKANASALASYAPLNSPTFTGTVNLSGVTASRALIADASKNITASAVTSVELGYLSGVTSAVQTQLDSKLSTSGQAATVATINGRISAGSGITISGAGTGASPYQIAATGGGGGVSYPVVLSAVMLG